MTTQEAAATYLRQHQREWLGQPVAVFNPHKNDEASLPVIFGFNNGGSPGWFSGELIAEDGECLGGHVCSSEGYMPHDLGILEGSRPDRHEVFQAKYPDGYRMEFVPYARAADHPGLNAAFAQLEQRQQTA